MVLLGKKILLGITGGIAAYKACELLRVLQKRLVQVRVVMTDEATKFVGPTTFAALSNFPVYTKNAETALQHIDYAQWADIYIIAPCSATSLARLISGTGEEPVSLCFLAMPGEKWVVPAMNSVMYNSPAVQKNLQTLRSWGVKVVEPEFGYLACGMEGQGKFPEPEDIADEIEFGEPSAKKTLLITIGRTQEAIDPVRYISNRSSGKTGEAIAKEFLRNGWRVFAVCGPMEAKLPKQCEKIEVKDAESMNKAVLKMQAKANVIVHCAAVADYRPKRAASQKIKNSRAVQKLELEETSNILTNTIKNKKKGQKIVSFALETENAWENAKNKFKNGIDVLIVNTPASGNGGFGDDFVEYGILTKNQSIELAFGSKEGLASRLFECTK
ncbi:MAG: bifunctional phosphopantothenoylcysteine decarboxylase/phosphopantothenate--cysteine ligase CoaBC [Fibromonadaceae bacterium]|jgi:phosphopantothenoylcysteine decarboxylase/phosphopantothenate--cysteine ligase|nr:bifunctional phosphopantothenoylcysteine decarboxylase/phosphopantothenate--cysteine ligase CoaBC [Fibromonadaceae bacterium]